MGGYYAYFTDDDGHITGRVTILASNDEEAKEQAQLLVDGYSRRAMAGRPQDFDIRSGLAG
jgi:hypothetical protein